MTCENCIHFDICNENADGNIVELMKEPCFRFKDKDSFNVKWREWNTVPNKNGDLISRQTFKGECLKAGFFPAQIAAVLKRTPAVDAVEVVRCKDCTHYSRHPHMLGMTLEYCDHWNKHTHSERFCSNGIVSLPKRASYHQSQSV